MSQSLHLFQPQYSIVSSDGTTSHWLPYSVGCLWAYLTQLPDIMARWNSAKFYYKREPIEQVLSRIIDPTVCAFSCYAWNEQYCLAMAQAIKNRWSNCVIIFGGPQSNSKYLKHDFIDSIVLGEGEESLAEILRCQIAGRLPEKFYQKKRLENLDIPSPYVLGLFDDIVTQAGPNTYWHTVLETNRGCPFACTFCDWGSTTYSKIKKFDLSRIESELAWIRDHRVTTLFLADANFGIFKERDLEIARLMRSYLEYSDVDYINPTYSKNSNETIFQIAKELGTLTKSVTLSMQSMNPATLRAIKRENLRSNDLKELLTLSEKYDIGTYTEMILGLPEETLESWCAGMCQLLEMGQHNYIDVFFASLLENSEMNLTQTQQFKLKTVKSNNFMRGSFQDESNINETVDIVCETSTMTKNEMCRAFMYSWVIQNFHLSGYSQILSKYCRHVLGISYRDFYDRLNLRLQNDDGELGGYYKSISTHCQNILESGDITDTGLEVHMFLSAGVYNLYQMLTRVIEFSISVAQEFGDINPSIIDIQRRFVINDTWLGETIVNSDYNLTTWEIMNCAYILKPKHDNLKFDEQSLIRYRRRGWMRHSLVLDL